jgi:hypothetical protein
MLAEFARSGFRSVEEVQNPTKVTVIRNPDVLVKKITGLRRLKDFQREERRRLEQETGDAAQAQLVMLTIHQRRTNELLAGTYTGAGEMLRQREAGSPQVTAEMEQTIEEKLRGLGQLNDVRSSRFRARLDKFRQGAGQLRSEDGEYTPVSGELIQLAVDLREPNESAPITDYALADLPRSQWEKMTVGTAEWGEWAREAVAEQGL